ncbi:MAG: DUF3775 domain-containing protein [Pseudomonadota bacterium]
MLQDLNPQLAGYIVVRMRASGEVEELDQDAHQGAIPTAEDVGLVDEHAHPHDHQDVNDAIDQLSIEAQQELVALTWLGRGDYSAQEWTQALKDARERWNKRTAAYLTGMSLLPDYLEEGLSALDYDLEAVELRR